MSKAEEKAEGEEKGEEDTFAKRGRVLPWKEQENGRMVGRSRATLL